MQRSRSVYHRLLTDGNIACYFNGNRAHKFQPAASRFSPPWSRLGLDGRLSRDEFPTEPKNLGARECVLCAPASSPTSASVQGWGQSVAAPGALLRSQPRARFAPAFKVKSASAGAGLRFAYVGKLQAASAPLAPPTPCLLPPRAAAVPRQDAAPAAARSAPPEPTFSPTLLFTNVTSSFVTGNLSQPPEA